MRPGPERQDQRGGAEDSAQAHGLQSREGEDYGGSEWLPARHAQTISCHISVESIVKYTTHILLGITI